VFALNDRGEHKVRPYKKLSLDYDLVLEFAPEHFEVFFR